MISREQEGITAFINSITGNSSYRAALKAAPSGGSFAGILSSELRARSTDAASGISTSTTPRITAVHAKADRLFSKAVVLQLINGLVAQKQPDEPAGGQTGNTPYAQAAAMMTPGIVQLPVQAPPAAANPDQGNKKTGSIDIASIVNFSTAGYKTSPNSGSFKILGDNTSVVVGSRSQLPGSDWEKYKRESASVNKKGSSLLVGGVMISLKVPLG
jgi:hypothetical protein